MKSVVKKSKNLEVSCTKKEKQASAQDRQRGLGF
jgi:hypothetical protein